MSDTSRKNDGKEEAYRDLYNPEGHYPENPRCKCGMCFMMKYHGGEHFGDILPYQQRILEWMEKNPEGKLNMVQQPRETLHFNIQAAEAFFRDWQAQFPELAEAARRITSKPPRGMSANLVILDDPILRGEERKKHYGKRRENRRARKARNKGGR